MGVGIGLPWTWYLEMPALLWVGVFMTADRMSAPWEKSSIRLAAPERGLVVPAASGHSDVGVLCSNLLASVERGCLEGGHRDVLRDRRRWRRARLGVLVEPKGRPRCSRATTSRTRGDAQQPIGLATQHGQEPKRPRVIPVKTATASLARTGARLAGAAEGPGGDWQARSKVVSCPKVGPNCWLTYVRSSAGPSQPRN